MALQQRPAALPAVFRSAAPTVTDLMRALAVELAVKGHPDPLGADFDLPFVWAALCRLSGEPCPPEIGPRNAPTGPASFRPLRPGVGALMGALLAELAEGEVPDPLGQGFALVFLWADLCRLAGEPYPPEVDAALDEPAVARLLYA